MIVQPDPTPTTAIVPAANGPRRPVSLAQFFTLTDGQQEYSSFDPSKMADAGPYLRAVSAAAKPLKECANEVIEIVHVIARPVELMNEETGELTDAVRLVMAGPDGQLWSTTSEPVIRIVSAAGKTAFGLPPWNPPMKFKVVNNKGRGTHYFLTLEPIFDPAPPAKTAQKK